MDYINLQSIISRAQKVRDLVTIKTETTYQRYQKTRDGYKELKVILEDTLREVNRFLGEDDNFDISESDIILNEIVSILANHSSSRCKPSPVQSSVVIEDDVDEDDYSTESDSHNSKEIVKQYCIRFSQLEKSTLWSPGSARCANALASWFDGRYCKNKHLWYSASAIPASVDKFIFAYAKSIDAGTEGDFLYEVGEWVKSLESVAPGSYFHVPYFIKEAWDDPEENATWQAIVIEREIKSLLYTDGFFADRRSSIEELVRSVDANIVIHDKVE